MPKKENSFIKKLFAVYEEILRLEVKFGKYIPIKSIKKSTKSITELRKLGIIFVPREGYLQRMFTFKWKDVKENCRLHELEKKL
jgi:hypothetical protein